MERDTEWDGKRHGKGWKETLKGMERDAERDGKRH